jgi:hypothetical protein
MQYLRRPARLGWDCEETQRDEANQNNPPRLRPLTHSHGRLILSVFQI